MFPLLKTSLSSLYEVVKTGKDEAHLLKLLSEDTEFEL